MPLYIRHIDNEEGKVCSSEWNLGQLVPDISAWKIVELHAEGKELDYILGVFQGLISKPYRNYALWEGSFARVIFKQFKEVHNARAGDEE